MKQFFKLRQFKLLFGPVDPAAAKAQGMSSQHHIAQYQRAIVLPCGNFGIPDNRKNLRCPIKGIKIFGPAADLGIASDDVFFQFRIVDDQDPGILVVPAAGGLQSGLQDLVEQLFFYRSSLEAANASSGMNILKCLVHKNSSPLFIDRLSI